MATLLAHIQINPGMEAKFEEVMADMYRITHSTEPDCLRYEYWRGEKEGLYYCLLSYKDNRAFWDHQASDHHEGHLENFGACIQDLKLEVLDPVTTASPLPAAQAQTVAADASELVKQQAEYAPMRLAQWWLKHRSST